MVVTSDNTPSDYELTTKKGSQMVVTSDNTPSDYELTTKKKRYKKPRVLPTPELSEEQRNKLQQYEKLLDDMNGRNGIKIKSNGRVHTITGNGTREILWIVDMIPEEIPTDKYYIFLNKSDIEYDRDNLGAIFGIDW